MPDDGEGGEADMSPDLPALETLAELEARGRELLPHAFFIGALLMWGLGGDKWLRTYVLAAAAGFAVAELDLPDRGASSD